jgi:prophage DNA circulation protein
MVELRTSVPDLVLVPSDCSAGIQESFRLYTDLTTDADAPYATLTGTLRELVDARAVYSWMPSTPTRTQANQNHDSIRAIVQRTSDVEASRVMLRRELASAEDALTVRDELATALLADMDEAGETGEDLVYAQLREHLGRVVQDLNLRALELPRRRIVIPQTWIPAVLLAYQVHEDVSREDQIIERNRILRPGFLPAGEPVEVLIP